MRSNGIICRRLWYIRKRNEARAGFLFKLACILLLAFLIGTYINTFALPALVDSTEVSARELVMEAVDAVMKNNPGIKQGYSGYVAVNTDGNATAVQVDYSVLNAISQDISKSIQKKLASLKDEKIIIPAGVLLGNTAFASYGPGLSVGIIPDGKVETEFESHMMRIEKNQTKHSLALNVKVNFGIVAIVERKVSVEIKIPVAETIILGNVTEEYEDKKYRKGY